MKSRNITSKCSEKANCDYKINTTITPILQIFSVTASGLELTLSNYQYILPTNQSLKIQFAGSLCQTTSINLPKILCEINKTSSNQLQLEAGYHKPSVHIQNIGYAVPNVSLLAFFVPINITSLNYTNGSSQGGQIVKINGNGFPINSKDLLNIQLGSANCQILETSNTGITIQTPPKNDTSILNLVFNEQNTSYNGYIYDDSSTPTIEALSPSTSSPSQKQILLINGTKFGSNKDKIRVFLDCSSKKIPIYELSVLNTTDNQLFVILGGGKVGSYYIRLQIEGVGSSKESQTNSSLFRYELTVSSISPNQGSIYGGTILTINGTNFSPFKNQNQVFVGDDPNNFCDIIECATTYILCRTRPSPTNYIDLQQKIIVTQRIQDEAVCLEPNCNFMFKTSISPQIVLTANVSNLIVARAGETLILNGTYLSPEANKKVIITFLTGVKITDNSTFDVNLSFETIYASSTQIKFIMPALIQASYYISVYVGNFGYANIDKTISIISPIEVNNITINDGSLDNNNQITSRGGIRINITGNGFNGESVFIDGIGFCPIYKNTTTWIYCISRQVWETKNKYNVSVYRDSNNKFTCSGCFFYVNDSKSLYLTNHSVANMELPCNFSLLAVGNDFNKSNNIKGFLEVYDATYKFVLESFEGEIKNISSKNISITFYNIPNNTYRLNIYYDLNGYVYMDEKWKLIKVSAMNISSQNFTSSYFGGKNLTLIGNGFPDMMKSSINNVTICGHLCTITENSIYSVKCLVPKFLTLPLINYYNLTKTESIFHNPSKIYSDTPLAQNKINDNLLSSYYDSGNNYCYVLFEFPENFLIQLQQIQYYPSTIKTIDNFYGLIFQASVDNSTYSTLFTLDENIKTGWNSWEPNITLPAYRYFKVSSPTATHKSRCNMAEIKFFGLKYYTISNGTDINSCDTQMSLNGAKIIIGGNVQYRKDNTPIVNDITPNMGPTSGGTTLNIIGDGFGTNISNVLALIDGIACNITALTNQKITCTTNPRSFFQKFPILSKFLLILQIFTIFF